MFHPIVFFSCWRYFQTRKIIWLSTLGVMIGVMVLIIVMSVMSGFQNDFRSRLQGTLSEITFTLKNPQQDYRDLLQQMKYQFEQEIVEIAPRLESLVLVGAPRGWRGGMLVGIEEKQERQVGSFSEYLLTSKKFKSEQFEDWMKPKSLLSLQWNALYLEAISKEDPYFVREEPHTRVFFQQTRLFKSFIDNFPDHTKEELFAFIFNEQGQIVAEEFYVDSLKAKSFPTTTDPRTAEKIQHYQRVLKEMMDAFQHKNLEKLMSHYHDDLEVYEILTEEDEEFKQLSMYHLSKVDPFDIQAFQKSDKRYFPILVGTEFLAQRGLLLKESGGVTILGGYYHRELKKIRSISKKYTIVGTFKTGMHEYDSNVIYCPLRGVQQLQMSPEALEKNDISPAQIADPSFLFPSDFPAFNQATHFSIALKDRSKIELVKQKMNQSFYSYGYAETWMDKRRILLDAVNLEKSVMNFILNFIILMAAVSIIFILWLMVAEKQKDIGILRSMGANSRDILGIFLMNGCFIAILGTLFGTILGLLFANHVNTLEDWLFQATGWKVFPRDVYYLDRIPVFFEYGRIAWVISWTILSSLLLSLIPAYLASKADPVKCLSHR